MNTTPYLDEHFKGMLRKWLSKESALKNFMRNFPPKEAPISRMDDKTFKRVSYSSGLDYSERAMKELYQFLHDEGHIFYDGNIFYRLIELD